MFGLLHWLLFSKSQCSHIIFVAGKTCHI